METKEELRLIARQAAKTLENKWSIGKFSNFMDKTDYDRSDTYDLADTEEIINLLLPFLQKAYDWSRIYSYIKVGIDSTPVSP